MSGAGPPSQSGPIAVRTASIDDVDPLSAMLARAFDDDPLLRFLLVPRSARRRSLHATRFFAWQLRRLVIDEQVHVAADGLGAALWALPGRSRESAPEALDLIRRVLPGVARHALRALRAIAAIERVHPAEPHLYLSVIGTDPHAQGRGIGSAAIMPGLELADKEGLPAYLESTKQRNIDFYARFGFTVLEELRLPGGGPIVWPMRREPAGGR